MLKLFRLSHIYQFENFSQQLVLTNCLPLILKFLDQNMVKYFQSKNELAILNYPRVVVNYARNKNTIIHFCRSRNVDPTEVKFYDQNEAFEQSLLRQLSCQMSSVSI
ncbi:DUF3402 domain-containing protein [Aphelenchoides bicaudatus]|nr:DUF3402 domain-containing protein [Aphelenchoides bicaudatus]